MCAPALRGLEVSCMSRALGCESPLPFVRLRSNLFVAALAALLLPAAAHASCTTSGNVTTCTSSGGITVSGTAGVSEGSSNVVSSLPGTVTAISVTLTDIDISGSGGLNNVAMVLVAPNGTALDILSGVCDSGEATITLEDSGATGTDNIDGLIPYLGGTCPSTLSGTYNATDWYPGDDVFDPPGPSTYNSAGLDNNGSSDDGSGTSDFHLAFGLPAGVTNMDGTWTLYIATQVAGYTTTGTLGSWSIAFTTEEAASTTTSISANPNGQTSNVYTSANGAATSVALTATVTSGGSPVTAGTVNFYDSTGSSAGDGTIIASGIALNGSGQAVANVDFTSSQEGLRDISAVYSGESGTYAGSISNEATVLTVNHPSNPSSGTYCNGPITIKSNSSAAQDGTAGYPYPSQIILSGISGTIENLTVELNGLQAEDPNYMGFMLQAPSGNALELMSWTDGNGPGGDPPALTSSSTDVYLDDTGSGLLQGSQDTDNTEVCSSGSPCRPADDYSEIGPLFTDTFPSAGSPFSSPSNLGKAYPTGTATLTSQFAGGTANGTWLLLLNNWLSENTSNNSSLPYGQLNQWCLSFTMQEGADATATTVSGTPNPASITSGTTASVTFTANVKDVSNSGTVVNAGSVTFVDGSTTLGTSPVNSSGQATLTASLNEGTHQIVASYSGTDSGSPEFGVSTGKTDVRVNKATTNPTTGSGAGPYSYCNAGSITAPGLSLDYGAAYPYPSNISVTNLPGTVEATTLTLNGFQTKDQGDLMSLLAGPGGSTLEFFSLTGSNVSEAPSPFNLTFSDTAESTIPSGSGGNLSSSGSYKPTSYNTSIAYPQCGQNAADCGTEDVGPPLGSASTFTPPFKATTAGSSILGNSNDAGEFGGTSSSTYNGNGTWSLYVDDGGPTGDGETTTIGNGWCVSLTVNPVSVTSEAGHSGTGANGNFEEGETNAQITATVNVGSDTGPTGDPTGTNPLTLTDALNSNFTYQSFSGAGWSCTSSGQTVTCTNDSAIAEGGSYPDLAINVNVASSPTAGSVTNQISVSGAGVTPTNSGIDTIAIDIPPAITSGSSATFAVGSANSFTVTTTGTPTPAIQETGSLPSGLTFTDNGNGTATLAGTPGAGTGAQYSLSISADNGTSPNATQTFTLTVDQAPAITSASGATFEAGSAGSFTVTAGGYPTPLITETGNLPAGVTLNTSGVLSGTPAAGTGGSYPIVINASNGVGSNATQNFTLLVEESPAITSATSATFVVGASSSFQVTASGVPPPIISETGTLPNGVTFTGGAGTATLSGTPAAGTGGVYMLTITADNALNPIATQTFALTVDQAPAITSASGATFEAGSAGSFTVTAGGYPTPLITETGNLPAGVTLSTSGVLSGTPAAGTGGSYPIVINASNGVGPNATQNFTLLVEESPAITSATSATFVVGASSSFQVTASGVPPPIISETGTLPNGVTFTGGAGTATLSGTPAAGTAGAYMLTITADNALNPIATQNFTLTVTPPPYLVVNVTTDDAGTASNCSTQNQAGSNTTDTSCSLRDALLEAASLGAANINFDRTAFGSAQTITLSDGTLAIPNDTSITGATSGSGASLANLVTVSGNNATTVFTEASGVANTSIANLIIANGNAASGNGGGISNGGVLTISGSTLSGNQAADGGAIDNGGTLTITGSTISGNTASQNGGGIVNNGTLTLTGSTLSGNGSQNGGGIIILGGVLDLTGGTLSGNTATQSGGGVAIQGGVLVLSNSIVSGNTGAASAPDDIDTVSGSVYTNKGGDVVGVVNGNAVSGAAITLAPLANYGGPTKTMVPLPGSAAICGGLASNIPSGVTTDQRGYPNTNTTYPGYSTNTPCVDSGAVQTDYAIGFTTQPPASAIVGLALSPAPVVSLTESGASTSVSAGTVTMTDSARLLTGTLSEPITSGAATFGNLVIPQQTTGDVLTATLPLTSSINLTVQATTSIDVTAQPATLISPTPGLSTILGTNNVQFTWSTGAGVTKYLLNLGTAGVGSDNLYSSGVTTKTSATVPTIPSDGVTVFAELGSFINGTWQYMNYVYTESGTTTPATLTPSSGMLATNQTFTWNNGAGPAEYILKLGTANTGSDNLYNSGLTTKTSTTVTIPSDGVTVFATLWQFINGQWQTTAYTFTEPGMSKLATLTPSSGTLATSQTFTWSNGVGPAEYILKLGTANTGSDNLYNSGITTNTSATVTIPNDGVTVFATLWQFVDGQWQTTPYTFTEPGTSTPATLTPSSGTLATSQTFTWNNGAGPAEYILKLGTAGAGSDNLYYSGLTTNTSATVTIPSDGVTVFASLWQFINGQWQTTAYTFTEPVTSTPATLTP